MINCVFVQSCLLLFARSFLDSDISKNQISGTCLLLYSLHSIDGFKIGQFDLLTVESGTSDCLSDVCEVKCVPEHQDGSLGLVVFFFLVTTCVLPVYLSMKSRTQSNHRSIVP